MKSLPQGYGRNNDTSKLHYKVSLCDEILFLVRAVTMECVVPLEAETWQSAMDVLFSLYATVIKLRPRLPLASVVHDVPDTILITTIRSMTSREHDWTRLCSVFGDTARKGKGDEPAVAQWAVRAYHD